MKDLVYRLRSIDRLLGQSKELERQQIFFAASQSLNDPMEGLKRFIWLGDDVLWRNLIQHYVQCLYYACTVFMVAAEDYPIGWGHIPIRSPRDAAPTPIMMAYLDELSDAFFLHSVINTLVESVAQRQLPVREHELRAYLTSIQPLAILEISALMRRHGLMRPAEVSENTRTMALQGVEHIIRLLSLIEVPEIAQAGIANPREPIFAAQGNLSRQLDLISRYNGAVKAGGPNRAFAFIDFPHDYPAQLEKLVFPEIYVACFSRNCNNSSLWGHYGDSHRGVCLIFDAKSSSGGLALKLRHTTGFNSAGQIEGESIHPFQPVHYQSDYPEVDFFSFLGMLPIPIINRDWYHSPDGRLTQYSSCAEGASDKQRQAHFAKFERITTTKTVDWAYEEELRLTWHSNVLDLTPNETRETTYDFSALHGIAFGIRTKMEDKLKIIQIIDQKCRAAKRHEFQFYQAYYSDETANIQLAPLSLLKFTPKDTTE